MADIETIEDLRDELDELRNELERVEHDRDVALGRLEDGDYSGCLELGELAFEALKGLRTNTTGRIRHIGDAITAVQDGSVLFLVAC